ncbi:hypothetical protein MICRO8M_130212 [Microbacterium sp. 8M]|nr:hypothetical protein MICRO8M_130212 [Microbacterium sp. 8M]
MAPVGVRLVRPELRLAVDGLRLPAAGRRRRHPERVPHVRARLVAHEARLLLRRPAVQDDQRRAERGDGADPRHLHRCRIRRPQRCLAQDLAGRLSPHLHQGRRLPGRLRAHQGPLHREVPQHREPHRKPRVLVRARHLLVQPVDRGAHRRRIHPLQEPLDRRVHAHRAEHRQRAGRHRESHAVDRGLDPQQSQRLQADSEPPDGRRDERRGQQRSGAVQQHPEHGLVRAVGLRLREELTHHGHARGGREPAAAPGGPDEKPDESHLDVDGRGRAGLQRDGLHRVVDTVAVVAALSVVHGRAEHLARIRRQRWAGHRGDPR